MRHEFTSAAAAPIDAGPPGTVTSPIDVDAVEGVVETIEVGIDVEHTWHGDLTISLLSPSAQRVILVDRRGGRGDHFRNTTFAAGATTSIRNAIAPFDGAFLPEGDLAELRGRPAAGRWQLEISDRAFQDGGRLNGWTLAIATQEQPTTQGFDIEVRFLGGLTAAQQDAFALAARRWSELIVGDIPPLLVDGAPVDDVVIEAEGAPIDGVGRVLGQAGPRVLRPDSFLPASGIMSFDTADLAQLEADGSLVRVIVHEMGHVLGLGTIWDRFGLAQGVGGLDPRFIGPSAMREFQALRGPGAPLEGVPLANSGGPGTRDSHWREEVFGNELMSGFLDTGVNPLSRLTVGALEDVGYEVDYDAADPYTLPTALELAMMGIGVEEADHGGRGIMLVPTQTVAPRDALV